MAKRKNYRFEKHQKDLAKQKKKEEKLLRKLERANQPADEATDEVPAPEDPQGSA